MCNDGKSGHRRCTSPQFVSSYRSSSISIVASLYKENRHHTLLAGPPAPDLLELLLGVATDSTFLARAAAPARVVLAGVAAAAAPGLADRLATVSEAAAAVGRRLEAAAPFFFLVAAR